MKTKQEFLDYAKRKNMNESDTQMMLHGVFHELKGIEHFTFGFCGLKWNGNEWIEK